MKIKLLLIILVNVFYFESCCYNRACEKGSLDIVLVAFSSSDIDTLIFRRFPVNTNYLSPNDTMLISDLNSLNPYVRNDSTYLNIYRYGNFKFLIQPGYNYELFIPGKNRVVRISDIVETESEEKHCDISDGNFPCINPINSYRIDGQINAKDYIFIRN